MNTLKALGVASAYIILYVLLDWISFVYPFAPFGITLWNPPPGLSVAFLLIHGLRFAPALFIAALVAEIVVRGLPLPWPDLLTSSAVLAAGYTGLAAVLRENVSASPLLASLRDLAWFIVSAIVATAFIALSIISVYVSADLIPRTGFLAAVLHFWIGDLIGVVVTTPFCLAIANDTVRAELYKVFLSPWMLIDCMAALGVLWIIFGSGIGGESRLFYLLFLPLILIAVHYGYAGVAGTVVGIQAGLVIAIKLVGYQTSTAMEFQFRMLVLAITGLFLGMAVSERRRTQEALARREAELSTLVATAPDGIFTLAANGEISSANAAAAQLFAAPPEALVGLSIERLIPELVNRLSNFLSKEVSAIRMDDTRFPAEVSLRKAVMGENDFFIGIVRDIGQRKETERRMQEQQMELNRALRLAAASEMASALAHELNQPLSAVRNYVRASRFLLDAPALDKARVTDTMDKAVSEATRAGNIVRHLRDFFRSGSSRLEAVNLGELIQTAVKPSWSRLERHQIALSVECPTALPPVIADRVQIEIALHNLIANAIDAICSISAVRREIRIQAAPVAPGHVQVTIRDSGPGIAEGNTLTIFEPFTTAKTEGMGLGLAMSRSIIEAHGGRLWAVADASGGVFHVTLPCQG
ncbi:MAG: MASE1 domain-containing protein [Gammaproteobacteria bacterium]